MVKIIKKVGDRELVGGCWLLQPLRCGAPGACQLSLLKGHPPTRERI